MARLGKCIQIRLVVLLPYAIILIAVVAKNFKTPQTNYGINNKQ